MLEIRPDDLDRRARYALMTSALVPRPIAWVSTMDGEGRRNLAPFSYFGGIASTPPLVAVAIGSRRGRKKDTWRNLEETGEGVIHIPTEELAEAMVLSSGDFPEGADEFALAGLESVASTLVRPPRVASAPLAMEVGVERIVELGDESRPTGLVVARILLFHVREDLLENGRIRPERLRPVGRLGDQNYARIRDVFEIPRPDAADLDRILSGRERARANGAEGRGGVGTPAE